MNDNIKASPATGVILQWLEQDRVLHEIACQVIYNDGNEFELGDLRSWVQEVLFDPQGDQFLTDLGIRTKGAQQVREFVGEGDMDDVDWDYINEQLAGV